MKKLLVTIVVLLASTSLGQGFAYTKADCLGLVDEAIYLYDKFTVLDRQITTVLSNEYSEYEREKVRFEYSNTRFIYNALVCSETIGMSLPELPEDASEYPSYERPYAFLKS